MPELPEVETIRRGLAPLIGAQTIAGLDVREAALRWRVDPGLAALLAGARTRSLTRRGKYLLLETDRGTLLLHLGMSGSLRYLPERRPAGRHDHVDLNFSGGACLRFNDPRRFGSLHFTLEPAAHPLLAGLGPEPLGERFTPEYLWGISRGRRVAIKQHLMNAHIVAGIGNIYASEALYRAGIHPARPAGRIARKRFDRLVECIRDVLNDAITAGGTTLRDFVGGDGRPGYFRLSLKVYDREGAPCERCGKPIRMRVLGQRATYYCVACQR